MNSVEIAVTRLRQIIYAQSELNDRRKVKTFSGYLNLAYEQTLMARIANLTELVKACQGRPIVLLGAGPSADFCLEEIKNLITQNAVFIVSDSVAREFMLNFAQADAIACSVEPRPHAYLRGLHKGVCFFYQHARITNLSPRQRDFALYFALQGESNPHAYPIMVSPGTVIGVQLSLALYIALRMRVYPPIHIFGCDLCFPENRMFNRFFPGHLLRPHGRFSSEESAQFEAVLRRSSGGYVAGMTFIRTAAEFIHARQNIETLLDTLAAEITIFDYSPLGISHPRVQKCIPALVSGPATP